MLRHKKGIPSKYEKGILGYDNLVYENRIQKKIEHPRNFVCDMHSIISVVQNNCQKDRGIPF